MINPQELRIGNIVNRENTGHSFEITADVLFHWDKFDKYLFPMVLTEEWLERFGGKKQRSIGRPFYCYEFERFEVMSDGYKIDCFFHDHMEGVYYKTSDKLYVHQLQNLVFALEGMELEIVK